MTGASPPAGHVAFAIDAGYLPWCAVAARSCIERSADVALHLHILHDGSLADHAGARALVEAARSLGAEATLHAVHDARLDALPALDRFGAIVWLRFLLPDVLPGVPRVLYLDADTLVTSSIGPLLATDLGPAALGAVPNIVEVSQWDHLRSLGIEDPREFLNSGVLLMDLDRMRSEGTSTALLITAAERGEDLLWPDQDALNLVFHSRWHHLDPRWNVQNSFWDWRALAVDVLGAAALDAATADPGIVHFEGPSLCKPWHALCVHPWRSAYWRTLRLTPWADTPPEDLTLATRIIRWLPRRRQVAAYFRLVRWRRQWTARRQRVDAIVGGRG